MFDIHNHLIKKQATDHPHLPTSSAAAGTSWSDILTDCSIDSIYTWFQQGEIAPEVTMKVMMI